MVFVVVMLIGVIIMFGVDVVVGCVVEMLVGLIVMVDFVLVDFVVVDL